LQQRIELMNPEIPDRGRPLISVDMNLDHDDQSNS
jgi:hypothetical protein